MPNRINVTARITPQTGAEGRGSWADKLKELVGVIGPTQAQNPPYMPFAAGTPTLATNQLMEQARSNAASEQLRSREVGLAETKASAPAAPTVPSASTARYAVRTAALGSALEEWQNYLAGLGMSGNQLPDASESEQWINKALPGLKAGIYDEMMRFGGSTEEAESVSLDIENFLRTRAGLSAKIPGSGTNDVDDIRKMLGIEPRE